MNDHLLANPFTNKVILPMILKMRAKHAVNHIMKVEPTYCLLFRIKALAFSKYAKALVICTPKFGDQEPKCL
jgi:hypothetical protein